MIRALLILGSVLLGSQGYTWPEKSSFYEDCEIFDREHVYGGLVCGSDGATYANSLYLDCLNYHNVRDVAVVHLGRCRSGEQYCETDLQYEPVCGTDNVTYTNLHSLLCLNHKYSRDVRPARNGSCQDGTDDFCERYGLRLYQVNPVCATNGLTYQNAGQVKCLRKRNPELKILHDGGCRLRHVIRVYGRERKACEIADTRYEWNPVCASNGLTYPNPFVVLCHEPGLRIIGEGPCGAQVQDSCTLIAKRNDASNSDDQQVCGTDGLTYDSVHHLRCQNRHDKYVSVRHGGPCSGPEDNPCGSIPEEDHRSPVCGNDGSSYVSPEALWCASSYYPAKGLRLVHDGPC